ncbi:hypothetical protein EAE96_000550 [Botrytis aclada]|nr:hypothetical protein EAE96_000550 [Botrytis aclada]
MSLTCFPRIFAGVFFVDWYLARGAVNFDHLLQKVGILADVSNAPGVFEKDNGEILAGKVLEVDDSRRAAGFLDIAASCCLQVG